jgi:hypothetical protein
MGKWVGHTLSTSGGSIGARAIDQHYNIPIRERGSSLLFYRGIGKAPTRDVNNYVMVGIGSKTDA